MLHLEYFVIALIVVGFIFFAGAIAILYPYLRQEAEADAVEIRRRELEASSKQPSAP